MATCEWVIIGINETGCIEIIRSDSNCEQVPGPGIGWANCSGMSGAAPHKATLSGITTTLNSRQPDTALHRIIEDTQEGKA